MTAKIKLELPDGGLRDGVIRVRYLDDRDAEAFAEGSGDAEVRRFAHLPLGRYTPRLVRNMVRGEVAEGLRSGQLAVFAIADAHDDAFLGSITLFGVGPENATAEVGFWLGPDGRGRGAASRALRLVCAWGAQSLGLRVLHARTAPDNLASQRLLERSGFERQGDAYPDTTPDGAEVLVLAYRRTCDS